MKLREFNMDNAKEVVPTDACLRVSRSAGLITFNRTAAEMLGLHEGGKIVFFQDENSPFDWFIKKSDSRNAFAMRFGKSKTSMDLNASRIAMRIIDSVQGRNQWKAVSFLIKTKPVEMDGENYYLIITAKPIKIKEKTK